MVVHGEGWLVLFAVILALLLLYHFFQERERREEMRQWAERKGLVFSPRRDKEIPERFSEFSLFRQGYGRKAYHVASGTWNGRRVLAFDYEYTTGAGRSRQTHHRSAAIVDSEVSLQPLQIRPETFFDKIGAFFGVEDINFESAQFSREFHVRSPDRRWAYDVLHPRTIEFLLIQPRFWIEMQGHHLIAWQERRIEPLTFDAALEVLAGILDRLPKYVVEERRWDRRKL